MRSAHPSAPLTGPDAPSSLENFLDLHARKLVIGLAIALAIVAVGVTIHLRQKKFEREAGAALVAAADLDALKKVTQDFGGTPAAKTALLLLADRQLEAGDAQGAGETLRAFIGGNADHPLISQARLALATALVRQGKPDEANAELEAFLTASPTSPLAPLALIQQAELAEQKGDLEGVRKLYEQVTAGFPDSQFAEMIKMQNRTERVGFVMPTEVEPPPPPPAPAPDAQQNPPPAGDSGGSLLEGEGPIPLPGTTPPAVVVPPVPDGTGTGPDTEPLAPAIPAPPAPPTQIPEAGQ
jgi:predicted negative regulator of RcsB-dependent stress response